MWEMLSDIEPFGGLSLDKINLLVVNKQMRPNLSNQTWSNTIIDLINSCWSEVVELRPSITNLKLVVEDLLIDME